MCSNWQVDQQCSKHYSKCIGSNGLLNMTKTPDEIEIEQNFEQEIETFKIKHPGYTFPYHSCPSVVGSYRQRGKKRGQTSAQEKSKTEQINKQNISTNVKEALGEGKKKYPDASDIRMESKKELWPSFLHQQPMSVLEPILPRVVGKVLHTCNMTDYLDMLYDADICEAQNIKQTREALKYVNSISETEIGNILCDKAKQQVSCFFVRDGVQWYVTIFGL